MYQGHCLTGTSCGYCRVEGCGYRSLFNQSTKLITIFFFFGLILNSPPPPSQHIDLLTAKKEDLSFSAPFSLNCTRDDCNFLFGSTFFVFLTARFFFFFFFAVPDIHAFLAWFDISFECTHKKVRFSTGPHSQYTHWKSVPIFFLYSTAHID